MPNELQPWERFSADELAAWVNDMIQRDFTGLLNLLYRLDINEAKLRKMLDEIQNEDAGKIIAALIIERQLQKIKSKQQFRQADDIPEEDKW
ncbi:MAG: hypothetical protein M0Q26_01970 [Chitinophagaceae bacterium]|nr:hypothetical protein [Chitinophagaceae bacterium]MDP1762969.1 hypothetical protein [Sediminibacterium sp.]MDP1811849.1 hypothetical protein [Sediminibacterium sp.]MDP3127620.1 hypothetical protein [Sediminibacterium sp.]MDP3667693.1 hypothetical protein [Sediminibacterium sp.]